MPKSDNPKVPRSWRINPEFLERLDREAKERGLSRTAAVQWAVKEWGERREAERLGRVVETPSQP